MTTCSDSILDLTTEVVTIFRRVFWLCDEDRFGATARLTDAGISAPAAHRIWSISAARPPVPGKYADRQFYHLQRPGHPDAYHLGRKCTRWGAGLRENSNQRHGDVILIIPNGGFSPPRC